MPQLTVVTRDGTEHRLEGAAGLSVMEIIQKHGIEELAAMCGGACSCATCHITIDPAFIARLPPMSEDEDDLLDISESREESSRLSCQIIFEDDLDGLLVTIARED